jgi:N-acetylglucosaminyl-diphospho-decaprenol L-rhamnosyltransferase
VLRRFDDAPIVSADAVWATPDSVTADCLWSIIIVLHNSAENLRECLQSIPAHTEVVVVDNASDDDGVDISRRSHSALRVMKLPHNVGFAAGCNAGASCSTGELLLFLNPDTVLEAGTLETLGATLAAEARAIAGPEIRDMRGGVRHVCRRRSSPLHELAELFPLASRIAPRSFRRDRDPDDPVYEAGGDVAYVQGAALAISRDFFFELGGFDEAFFLYTEEEELCARAWAAGGRCRYEPRAAVRHAWGTSTECVPAFATQQHFRSRMVLYRRRYGIIRGALVAGLFGAAICARTLAATVRRSRAYRLEWALPALRGVAAGYLANPRVRRPFT